MSLAPDCVPHSFYRRTRKGKVLHVERERYLRDDLGYGTLCGVGTIKTEDHLNQVLNDEHLVDGKKQILVLDTNVVLNQIDLLEKVCPAFYNVVLCDTVLQEARSNNLSLYNRILNLLREEKRIYIAFANQNHRQVYQKQLMGETANDYNDRLIRGVAKWYRDNVESAGIARVTLLTNDRACLEAAQKENLHAFTVQNYVKSLSSKYPELIEVLAHNGDEEESNPTSKRERKAHSLTAKYEEHLSETEISRQLKQGTIYQGILRVNMHHPVEATVMVFGLDTTGNPSNAKEDAATKVFIRSREAMNRSMDGDKVAIKLTTNPESVVPSADSDDEAALEDQEKTLEEMNLEGTKTKVQEHEGKVVGVIKRNWRPYAGSIDERDVVKGNVSSESVMFVPVDKRIPKIRIRTRQLSNLADKRIIVSVDAWSKFSTYPEGHFVSIVGTIGDRETETKVLLHEHDIPTREFSKRVLQCLPKEGKDWVVTEENSSGRTDLRHLNVCSIDPPGCKDIDDALHVRTLPNGNIEVGVHIADVTHFVRPGTAIDEEAKDRGTSTYLVERRLDMLPGLLTTDICSLVGNVDRFAFSVLWELTPPPPPGTEITHDVITNPEYCRQVGVKFTKSVIHSKAALAYGEAQAWIEDERVDTELARSVRTLNRVAKVMRGRRVEAGALTLASPEVRFKLDNESHDPTDVEVYQQKDANALVEEFMLFANITVAKRITERFPRYAMLRRHPSPSRQMFDDLLAAAKAAGVKIGVDTSKQLADSLDAAVRDDQPFFNKLIRIMATRCMQQAVYFCSGELTPPEYLHYGLATPIYTHFTSPIRRYADVVVHRLLAAAEDIDSLPGTYERKDAMRAISDNINKRHHMAQLAGRASIGLHTIIFFKNRPVDVEATVIRVKSRGIVVVVPQFGIEGKVRLVPKDSKQKVEDLYTYNESTLTLTAKENGKAYSIFDPVKVHIEVEQLPAHRQELVITIADENAKMTVLDTQQESKKRSIDTVKSATKKKKTKSKKRRKSSS